jgi:hypothetical protein
LSQAEESQLAILKRRVFNSLQHIDTERIYPRIDLQYYNELSDFLSVDIAALLAAGVGLGDTWFDDTLITRIIRDKLCYQIWGVVITGTTNGSTKQWTMPFYFKVNIALDLISLSLGDAKNTAIPYTEYSEKRGYWDRDYYTSQEWNINQRDWVYRVEV